MKLNRRKLRQLILAEIFEKGAKFYSFRLTDEIVDQNESLYFCYKFLTDDGLNYEVDIKLHWSESYGHEDEWDVDFDIDRTAEDSSDFYALTGSYDLKVLNTIIEIVKDFVANVRPRLPDPFNQIIDFNATVAEESDMDDLSKRDDRRARIYQYMMRKRGITSKISYDRLDNIIIQFQI